jgi:hypothetical protein
MRVGFISRPSMPLYSGRILADLCMTYGNESIFVLQSLKPLDTLTDMAKERRTVTMRLAPELWKQVRRAAIDANTSAERWMEDAARTKLDFVAHHPKVSLETRQ